MIPLPPGCITCQGFSWGEAILGLLIHSSCYCSYSLYHVGLRTQPAILGLYSPDTDAVK
jgi:hypothetical protein